MSALVVSELVKFMKKFRGGTEGGEGGEEGGGGNIGNFFNVSKKFF